MLITCGGPRYRVARPWDKIVPRFVGLSGLSYTYFPPGTALRLSGVHSKRAGLFRVHSAGSRLLRRMTGAGCRFPPPSNSRATNNLLRAAKEHYVRIKNESLGTDSTRTCGGRTSTAAGYNESGHLQLLIRLPHLSFFFVDFTSTDAARSVNDGDRIHAVGQSCPGNERAKTLTRLWVRVEPESK